MNLPLSFSFFALRGLDMDYDRYVNLKFEIELSDVADLLSRVERRGYFTRGEAEFLELFFCGLLPSGVEERLRREYARLYEKARALARALPIKTR
jgi:hypothetical protein